VNRAQIRRTVAATQCQPIVVGEGKPEYKPSFAVVVIVSASTRYGIEYSDSKSGAAQAVEGSTPLPSALTISVIQCQNPLPCKGFAFRQSGVPESRRVPSGDTSGQATTGVGTYCGTCAEGQSWGFRGLRAAPFGSEKGHHRPPDGG